MAAVQETIDQVRKIDVDQYKYGFETKIDTVKAPKGLDESTVRFISAKKGEPEWMLAWRLEAYTRWRAMTEPTWAKVHYPKIDFQDLYYYSAPKSTEGPKSLADVDPELLAHLREARHSAEGARDPGRRAGRARRRRRRVRQRLRRHHLQGRAGEGRRHLLLDLGSRPRASRAGEEVPGLGRAAGRQLLCRAELGRVLRRLVRLRAGRRALPDGAVDLLPHQREADRPVRAHAHHRRQGLLRVLSRGLHGADARREPAARGRRRADRARRRRDQVLDGAELVPRRQERQGRHL